MADKRITVDRVDPPGEGKKQATVKDTTGEIYGFFPDAGFIMVAGDTYDVDLRSRDYRGKTYYTISGAKLVSASHAISGESAEPTVEKDEHIYVTGVVGRAMGSGKFGPEHISLLTKAASQAYGEWMEAVAGGLDMGLPDETMPDDPLPPGFE